MRIFGFLIALFLLACSNLSSPRFSKNFYEEKRLQLTRKSELIENGKTALVAFSTYVSSLDFKTYPNGEVFLVELAFENDKIKFDDLSFSLLGRKPFKVQKVSQIMQKTQKFFIHSQWNELYLVFFESVSPMETTDIVLKMHIRGRAQELSFDYSYIVENVL